MPALGADMDEGTLLEWLVKPGDEIHKGDVIAVVDTAKSAIEVESFHTGVVERLVTQPGITVPVGTVLALIKEAAPGEAEGQQAPAGSAEAGPAMAAAAAAQAAAGGPVTTTTGAPSMPRALARSTPLVRRVATELGVDLATVPGTGRNGAVTRADVERAAGMKRAAPEETAQAAATAHEPVPGAEGPGPAAARRRVTPLARRMAAELGVDLSAVTGTGAGGVVREDDVRRAARAGGAGQAAQREPERPTGRPPAGQPVPQGAGTARAAASGDRAEAMRQAIARLMARSKREIPHYYVSNTVDMAVALGWLRERNREIEVSARLLPAALLLKVAALAARQVPQLNGFWTEGRFVPALAVHLGVAVSLRGGGLVTPAIHDAADLPASELMLRLRDLVNRARAGRLRGSELTDATITVTNLGDQGVESVTGVIYPPQVALVGFGKIVERPWAVNGLLGVRPVVVTTLSADHRATDGYDGARFLGAIANLLQRPEEL